MLDVIQTSVTNQPDNHDKAGISDDFLVLAAGAPSAGKSQIEFGFRKLVNQNLILSAKLISKFHAKLQQNGLCESFHKLAFVFLILYI